MKGLGNKPIILLNTLGFYDGFVSQLARAQTDGLLYKSNNAYFLVAQNAAEAVQLAEAAVTAADNAPAAVKVERMTAADPMPQQPSSSAAPAPAAPAAPAATGTGAGAGAGAALLELDWPLSLIPGMFSMLTTASSKDPLRRQERRAVFLTGMLWGGVLAGAVMYLGITDNAVSSAIRKSRGR